MSMTASSLLTKDTRFIDCSEVVHLFTTFSSERNGCISNRTRRPSVTFPVLNPFLATSLHDHFSYKSPPADACFVYLIIIINIIVIGVYPHGYNCIIIYRVPCYFNRLIRPRPTAETTTAASRISRCNNESSEVDNEKIKKRTIFPIRGLDKEKNDISHPGSG